MSNLCEYCGEDALSTRGQPLYCNDECASRGVRFDEDEAIRAESREEIATLKARVALLELEGQCLRETLNTFVDQNTRPEVVEEWMAWRINDLKRQVADKKTTSIQLNFEKRKPTLCASCGKDLLYHRAGDHACPLGSRHRVVGYTQYHATNSFTPKAKK